MISNKYKGILFYHCESISNVANRVTCKYSIIFCSSFVIAKQFLPFACHFMQCSLSCENLIVHNMLIETSYLYTVAPAFLYILYA